MSTKRIIPSCLGIWLVASPAWAQQAPADAQAALAPVPAVTQDIFFDADLLVDQDLMLEGITATETVNFRVPSGWDLTQDPVLHLKFNHSRSLIESRSVLTVWVNNAGAGSVRLSEANIEDGELVIRLPRTAFYEGGFNDLQFRVVQHLDDECEDPFDPAVWTRVQLDSYITFHYRDKALDTDLINFPAPYFDRRGYGPMELSLAGIETASSAQLEALAILGFTMGRHAGYRGLSVRGPVSDPSQATSHVLLVGTPAENKLISRYVDTTTLRSGVGTVASIANPSNPTKGILIVTGGDAEGVIKAAEALASRDRHEALSGQVAGITEVREPVPPDSNRVPLPVPDRNSGQGIRFPISELRLDDTTVRGFYAPPVRVPLHLEGDAEVHIDGARVGIDYAYSSGLDTRLSTMEVRLDDVTLRSVALNDSDGDEKSRLWVDLPYELMKPDSELEVVFHLFPLNFDPCVYVTDKHIWGTVFGSTEVRIARDGYTELPDLGKLKYDLWPLNAALGPRGGLSIVAPDAPGPWDASAVLQSVGQLGAVSTVEAPDFELVRGGSAVNSDDNNDLLVLVGSGANRTYSDLKGGGYLSDAGDDADKLLSDAGDRVLAARVGTPYGTVEQSLVDNKGIGRTALIVKAPTSQELLKLVKRLSDPSVTSGMTGNLAVVGSGRDVRSLSVVESEPVGTRSAISTLRRVLQGAWAALVVGVIAASILIALLIRAWAARRGGEA